MYKYSLGHGHTLRDATELRRVRCSTQGVPAQKWPSYVMHRRVNINEDRIDVDKYSTKKQYFVLVFSPCCMSAKGPLVYFRYFTNKLSTETVFIKNEDRKKIKTKDKSTANFAAPAAMM